MKSKTVILVLMSIFSCAIFSEIDAQDQSDKEVVKILNDCVDFTNESIHGLLIAHRLFENFNQKLNYYVDLDDQQLNFYSNKDLPKNIFEDPDNWFYETSPMEWYRVSVDGANKLRSHDSQVLKRALRELKQILLDVNNLRFELEYILKKLEDGSASIEDVYNRLENVSKLYNQSFIVRNRIEEAIADIYYDQKVYLEDDSFYKFYNEFIPLHRHVLSGIRHYRFEENESLPAINVSLAADVKNVPGKEQLKIRETGNSGMSSENRLKRILDKTANYKDDNNQFVNTPVVPEKYRLYGENYYYHNVIMLSHFNRYGNGIVNDMNVLLEGTGLAYLKFMEEPHIFKVLYPKKLEETKVEEIETVAVVEVLPDVLEEREIVKRQNAIEISQDFVEIEIYDHQKLDRDIVSINFNGEWILEEYTISDKPKKIRLKLNNDGVNYLILHAVNVGVIPPNTMALVYKINGKKERIILNSDLEQSELIELKR